MFWKSFKLRNEKKKNTKNKNKINLENSSTIEIIKI